MEEPDAEAQPFHTLHKRKPTHNLPLALSSFVGREREVAEVERLVGQEEARLVTLSGPGGAGKTRLALAVAQEAVEGFEEGAWWVTLASLSDPDLVTQATASALGMREAPGRALGEALVEHLAAKDLLLVLDNCEHLIEACAALADTLLRACPRLTILATSREALGLAGEASWEVPPLSSPADPEQLPSLEELGRYEAVRLFVERAKATSGFVLSVENAPAVARLCRRLEGIPLAVELAAARTKVLSAGQILGRLEDSLGLLVGRDRTAPTRQRTLRGTLDWSYELLSEQERDLFGRLSVFAGGWALEAAEAVGAGEYAGEEDVLDLLSGLVDKSLVVVAEAGGGDEEVRYRMLEPVRQYGLEMLEESAEAGETRNRHAAWFLALAQEAEPHLKGRKQVAWLERLEREHDNLRAAMRRLLEEGEVERPVRLAWALWLFWYLHGHQDEGYRYAGELLDKIDALPPVVRSKVLIVRGNMSYGRESIEGTKQLFEEAAALSRQMENGVDLAIALAGVGVTDMQQGDMQRASTIFEEVLMLYRELADKWGESYALVHLGMAPLSRGDHAGATRYFEEALAISREIGYRLSGYISLYSLALASHVRGDHEQAAKLYVEGLELAVEAGDKANAAYCLEGLAGLIAARDEPELATRLFGASEALLEAVGAPLYAHAQDRALYDSAVRTLQSRSNEKAFEALWAEGRAMTLEQAVEHALAGGEEESASSSVAPAPSYPGGLSSREAEVLKFVAKGLTNAQVAKELFISPRTVNSHLNSIYAKLEVGSRAAATRFALEHDLA
jgi:predicted ATPase/DNA-binding CsgD family transcriptional regulator